MFLPSTVFGHFWRCGQGRTEEATEGNRGWPELRILAENSCGWQESTAEAIGAGNTTPTNEVDLMINNYEKVTNQYVRVARKLKGGDMSVTVPYIGLGKEIRTSTDTLQQIAAKMTPEQTQ